MMVADYERRLAAAETELENWKRRKFPGTKLDHGTLNLPLAQRGITDADLSTYHSPHRCSEPLASQAGPRSLAHRSASAPRGEGRSP